MALRSVIRAVEKADVLDPVANFVANCLGGILGRRPLKDALSGSWFGHPLHPALVEVPVGVLAASSIFELVGGSDADEIVDALTGLGLLAVLPAAVTGASDWSDTVDGERRLGLAHGLANASASGFYLASLLSRRGGARGRARLFSLLGLGALGAGAYAGGHLVYARGVGVDHTVFEQPPADWTPVARDADVADETPMGVSADGYRVMLYRRDSDLMALADTCSHAGGPLSEGEVDDDLCVSCPWHGSRFRLSDGSIVNGPASAPQPVLDVRVRDGHVEVRGRPS